MGNAAGLGALGFWLFLAAVVVAGIWFDAKKRESQQETLRRIIESGQRIDQTMVDKLLKAESGSSRTDRELKVGGLITFSVAPGLLLLGYFLARLEPQLMDVMLGVALLVGLIGAGLFAAGKMSERWYNDDKG
jgi:nitrate/nitrite transporter NarK